MDKWIHTSWWFQPHWKRCSSNWIISQGEGKNKTYVIPPPRFPVLCSSTGKYVIKLGITYKSPICINLPTVITRRQIWRAIIMYMYNIYCKYKYIYIYYIVAIPYFAFYCHSQTTCPLHLGIAPPPKKKKKMVEKTHFEMQFESIKTPKPPETCARFSLPNCCSQGSYLHPLRWSVSSVPPHVFRQSPSGWMEWSPDKWRMVWQDFLNDKETQPKKVHTKKVMYI